MFRSFDGGESWQEWISKRAYCLQFDPANPSVVYLGQDSLNPEGGRQPGILKSTDGGATWQDSSYGYWDAIDGFYRLLPCENLWIDPVDPAHLYALAGDNDVFESLDGGDNWTPTDLGACGWGNIGYREFTKRVRGSLLVVTGTSRTLYVGYENYDESRTPFDRSGLYAISYPPDASIPDLRVATDHVEDGGSHFEVGSSAVLTVTVTNQGTGPTTGPITLTDQLPEGMTFTGMTGASWDCTSAGALGRRRFIGYRPDPFAAKRVLKKDGITGPDAGLKEPDIAGRNELPCYLTNHPLARLPFLPTEKVGNRDELAELLSQKLLPPTILVADHCNLNGKAAVIGEYQAELLGDDLEVLGQLQLNEGTNGGRAARNDQWGIVSRLKMQAVLNEILESGLEPGVAAMDHDRSGRGQV